MKSRKIIYRNIFVNYISVSIFILCCFIPINESFYNNNYHDIYENNFERNYLDNNENTFVTNKREHNTKSPRTMWKEKTEYPIMTFPPYSRTKPTSGLFPQDLISQETMDVSNSIWENNEHKSEQTNHNNVDWNGNPIKDNNFEQNVLGLVDEWIYNDYDEYENYPNEDNFYQNTNDDPNSRWNLSPKYLSKSYSQSFSSSPFQDYSMTKANRRADHVDKDNNGRPNNHPSNYQSPPETVQKAAYRKRKGDYEENKGNKNVEGKQIISGIDINPLTSNALRGFTKPSDSFSSEALKDFYKNNDIFSNFKFQTNRMKKGFDKAIQGVGDATIGENNKQAFKQDVKHFVNGFADTMNEIDDNSINTQLRNKLKFVGKDSVMSSLVKKERLKNSFNDNRKVENKKKFPQIIQRVKNNIKGMGNFVLKKTKQMLVETPKTLAGSAKSNFQLDLKDEKLERQGGLIGSFGSLLSSVVGGPAMTWVSVVSLVVVEVLSMGLQSAFQINQSTPTEAPAKPTEAVTKAPCDLLVCTGDSDACTAGTCMCGSSAKCAAPLSNICTSSTCKCGSSTACTSGSTVATCLSSAAAVPTNTDTAATCKCSGTGATDSCFVSTNTGYDATKPLCGTSTVGTIGVCGACTKVSGSAGAGDGSTQGSCPTGGTVCCSNGSCQANSGACP